MADKEYSQSSAAHGLSGFSSNSDWADPDALWSHQPAQEGPKEGFHDPASPPPVREQIWNGGN